LNRRSCNNENEGNSDSYNKNNAGWLKSVSLEPGIVATDIWRYSDFGYDPRKKGKTVSVSSSSSSVLKMNDTKIKRSLFDRIKSNIFYRCMTPVDRGANTQIWLASCETATATATATSTNNNKIESGQHYDEFQQKKILPKFATNINDQKKLWRISEELTSSVFQLSKRSQ
ncbi:MAG: hypothetical protein ACI8RD_012353, partial [Bacillariaceae sp.]